MSKWISVEDELPTSQDVDVWIDGYRVSDCSFVDGDFEEVVLDHDGDYSHMEKLDGVTHWMYSPEPPEEE